ncbi:hypothetical protein Bbelb_407390 [Branchiostoma belcheri]|nr:hypothetical protein Bbelb_407390 [Branchiostoma belcheri]
MQLTPIFRRFEPSNWTIHSQCDKSRTWPTANSTADCFHIASLSTASADLNLAVWTGGYLWARLTPPIPLDPAGLRASLQSNLSRSPRIVGGSVGQCGTTVGNVMRRVLGGLLSQCEWLINVDKSLMWYNHGWAHILTTSKQRLLHPKQEAPAGPDRYHYRISPSQNCYSGEAFFSAEAVHCPRVNTIPHLRKVICFNCGVKLGCRPFDLSAHSRAGADGKILAQGEAAGRVRNPVAGQGSLTNADDSRSGPNVSRSPVPLVSDLQTRNKWSPRCGSRQCRCCGSRVSVRTSPARSQRDLALFRRQTCPSDASGRFLQPDHAEAHCESELKLSQLKTALA